MDGSQRLRFRISIVGVLAVVAYATWAATQILVLNPLAAVPGRSLADIRAELAAAGEGPNDVLVFVVLGIGVVLAVVLAVIAVSTRAAPRLVVMLFLALLMLGTPGYFVASFNAGMSLADTFAISGADVSPWAAPLYIVSAVSVAAIVGTVVVIVRWDRRRDRLGSPVAR